MTAVPHQAVAITGMAGRFPGASGLDEFWRNLRGGVESITFYSREELLAEGFAEEILRDPQFVPATGELAGSGLFDAAYFNYSPREAELMDPQHRLFLECADQALQDANVVPSPRLRIAVLGGAGINSYLFRNVLAHPELIDAVGYHQVILGNDKDYLATRVAYKLGLTGPALTVQTACSTSLVAVHLACRTLLTYEADVALAGGATVASPQRRGYLYSKGNIASPDGHCRAFDARAEGLAAGSGVGVVVLRRLEEALEDRDTIHGVILGSAVNNDGDAKVGYTAPSVRQQAEVIAEALDIAQVSADTIDYVEAHGTATALGDPVELTALSRAFRRSTDARGYCALGSVKTNFGHLDAAAGIAGLVKTVLSLAHREIPPSLNFETPNPHIELADSPFYVNTRTRPWPSNGSPRRAGVSAFGLGGTNAHVILEEAPSPAGSVPSSWPQLLVISAKTATALDTSCADLAAHLRQHPELDLADVAHTLQVGRRPHAHRRTVVCTTGEAAIAALTGPTPEPASVADRRDRPVVFMFPGVTAVSRGTARELYARYPEFRTHIDTCCAMLAPRVGCDLRDLICAPAAGIAVGATCAPQRPAVSACATFALEYALAALLLSWGIAPRAMVGHSMGEYVAACLAGVFRLEDALRLVALRYELLERLPPGAMLSVPLPAHELRELITDNLAITAANGPADSVVSGPADASDALAETLAARGVYTTRLAVPVASHSPMLDKVLDEFADAVAAVPLEAPTRPYVSCVTGTWVGADEVRDPRFWVRQFRDTVRFADALATLAETGDPIFLEVGPGPHALTTLAAVQNRQRPLPALPLFPHPWRPQPAVAFLLEAMGQLWRSGVAIASAELAGDERRRRVRLPTYPFERQHHWLDPGPAQAPAPQTRESNLPTDDPANWFAMPSWHRAVARHIDPGDRARGTWMVFRGDSETGPALCERLSKAGGHVVVVEKGDAFDRVDDRYAIDPSKPDQYMRLLESLRERGQAPNHVVHAWALDPVSDAPPSVESFERAQEIGLYSVLYLMQALAALSPAASLTLWLVTDAVHDVTGDEPPRPEAATLLGPVRGPPHECPAITCHHVDVRLTGATGPAAQRVVDQLVGELLADDPVPMVAFRGPHRWVPSTDRVRIDRGAPAFRQGGRYLLTGGLDGNGAAIADYLTTTYGATVVAVEAEDHPAEDEWDAWLTRRPDDDPVSRHIRLVRTLRAKGASIQLARADVAAPDSLRQAVLDVRQRIGDPNGVIHCVGPREDGIRRSVRDTSLAVCQEQLRRHAHSTIALAHALEGISLDFCLVRSTLSTRHDGLGQVAGSGASAFVDAFVHALRRTGADHLLAADWSDGVQSTDLANLLERLVAARHHGHLIASWNDPSSEPPRAPDPAGSSHLRPALPTRYEAPRNEIEAEIISMWQEVLGVEPLGVHDDFFALGGHSLLGTQIVARLRPAFGVDFPLRELYEASTVAELAERVVQLRAAQSGGEDLEQLLADLERLTEDGAGSPDRGGS